MLNKNVVSIKILHKKAEIVGSKNDLKQSAIDHVVNRGDLVDVIELLKDGWIKCRANRVYYSEGTLTKKFIIIVIPKFLVKEVGDLPLDVLLDS